MPTDPTIQAAWIGVFGGLIASGFGAFFGAWYAYKRSKEQKLEEETNQHVQAANVALFVLMRQFNLLANMKKQHLDEFRTDPVRIIHLLPVPTIERNHLRLDLASLNFVISTTSRDTLLLAMLADDWFHQATDIQNRRFNLHSEQAQPKIEAALAAGQPETFSMDQVKDVLGQKLFAELKQSTDLLYEFVDEGIKKHKLIGLRFAQEMKQMFPKHSFISFDAAIDYFKEAAGPSDS